MAMTHHASGSAGLAPARPAATSGESFVLPQITGRRTRVGPSSAGLEDDPALLDDVLRCHGLPADMIDRLTRLAAAPTHASRLVDRFAIALAADFNFLAFDEALRTPTLLYGAPGVGVSTVTAKLAARFDEGQVLAIGTAAPGSAEAMQLAENLEVLGVPLALAPDAETLRAAVATANGRTVLIDMPLGASPTNAAAAERLRAFTTAAGAQSMLILPADMDTAQAAALGGSAARLGTRQMILTRVDVARYIGAALIAATTGQLAIVAASVSPHFAFGLRALGPENLARRLILAALKAERWRIAPL